MYANEWMSVFVHDLQLISPYVSTTLELCVLNETHFPALTLWDLNNSLDTQVRMSLIAYINLGPVHHSLQIIQI